MRLVSLGMLLLRTHEELVKNVKKEQEYSNLMKENEYLVTMITEKQHFLVTLKKENEPQRKNLRL